MTRRTVVPEVGVVRLIMSHSGLRAPTTGRLALTTPAGRVSVPEPRSLALRRSERRSPVGVVISNGVAMLTLAVR
jgi:hypothetical protein